MTSKEALENITDWIEYFTRLDYVEPIVRGEVQKNFYEAYHKTRPELELIEKDLKLLEILKNKKVCIYVLLDFIRRCVKDNFVLESYNHYVREDRRLTQEEFNLIKEWLDEGES